MSVGSRRDAALKSIQKATELAPNNALYFEQLADLHAKLGEGAAVAASARRSVELDGDRDKSKGILGAALLGFGQAGDAIDWSLAAIALDPRGLEFTESYAAANLYVAYLKDGQANAAARLVDLDNLIYTHDSLDGFNGDLAAAIRTHPSLQWNPAGYVTRSGAITGNVLLRPAPVFQAMESAIRHGIDAFTASLTPSPEHHSRRDLQRRYRMVMWAVILDQEGYLETHIHEGSWISGAYYVSIPAFKKSPGNNHPGAPGAIEFGRPSSHYGIESSVSTRVVQA